MVNYGVRPVTLIEVRRRTGNGRSLESQGNQKVITKKRSVSTIKQGPVKYQFVGGVKRGRCKVQQALNEFRGGMLFLIAIDVA